jgi:antitoxin component of MazEF toxin-antitoxin module
MTLTLRRIGNSIGCTLPKRLLDPLKLGAGDQVEAIEKNGKIELAPLKKIRPIKLGGLWKDAALDMDLEDFRRLRREMWKGLGKETS